MKKEQEKRLSEGIYYSHESLMFYRGFYAGMGMDDVRELPSSLNSYLHQVVEVNALDKGSASSVGCVGRYRDENENDEKVFDADFEGYFTDLVPVYMNLRKEDFSANSIKPSKRLSKALTMATNAYPEQRRKSNGSSYICHLLEIQDLLVNVGDVADQDIVIAGILQAVTEDSHISKAALLHGFGSRIVSIVEALTDDKRLSLEERRDIALVKLKSAPKSVKVIQLAHACTNSSAIPKSWKKERVTQYFNWLDKVVKVCRDANESLFIEYQNRKQTRSHS